MKQAILNGYHTLKTTRHRWLRISIGVLLVVAGGLAGFLPVLGYWMVPLGLALLAVDWQPARRINRYLVEQWKRFVRKLRGWANR